MNPQQTQILAYCSRYFENALGYSNTLFTLGTWAFGLAIALAVISTLVDILVKVKAANAAAAGEGGNFKSLNVGPVSPDMVKALTAALDSLVKAPVWFFLFLGGIALVWLSTVNVPRICEPAAPTPAVAAAAPDGVAAKAPATPAGPISAKPK